MSFGSVLRSAHRPCGGPVYLNLPSPTHHPTRCRGAALQTRSPATSNRRGSFCRYPHRKRRATRCHLIERAPRAGQKRCDQCSGELGDMGTGLRSDCVFANGSARAIEAQAKPYTQEAISHILTRHEVMFTWWLGYTLATAPNQDS